MDKPKIILFDIDHTIFDTDVFRKIIYKKLSKKLNLKYDDFFLELIKKSEKITINKKKYFDPDFFLKTLTYITNSKLKPDDLGSEFWDESNFEQAIYPEVTSTFNQIKKNKNISIGIFSRGETKFQKRKIEILKESLDKKHVYIFANKLEEINMIINKYKDYQILIVDNLLEVLEFSKKVSKRITTVYIKRLSSLDKVNQNIFKPDYEINNLEEVISIVKNN